MTELRPTVYDGYFAGDDGRIYSTRKRWVPEGTPPLPLSPGRQENGYQCVNLSLGGGGQYKMARVHALVCEAFHGPRPPGMDCSHLDDDKDNNRPENLRWESPRLNQSRRRGNGIDDRGVLNSRAVLSEADVREVRSLLQAGQLTHQAIADHFGVSRTTISRVANGHRYHLTS